MLLKAFSIFSSLGAAATAPFVLPKQDNLQNSFQTLSISRHGKHELKNIERTPVIDFFARYFENISKYIVACKADNLMNCPSLFYLEDKSENQKAVLQVFNSMPSKHVELDSSSNDVSQVFAPNSSMENKKILNILPAELKKKAPFVSEISSIKVFDDSKLSINLFDGEAKMILFNIPEQFENLSKLRDYCQLNVEKKDNLVCRTLEEEVNVNVDNRKVLYR